MKVLSLFDGLGGARQALKDLKIPVEAYYASELDASAVKVAEKNHPDIKSLGDVTKIDFSKMEEVDLIIAGSPCQDLSSERRTGKGLKGEKSKLFFKFLDAVNILQPKYFFLENVASMTIKNREIISHYLEVPYIKINSALVSAQKRNRLYWTNIEGIEQPEDRGITFKDIKDDSPEEECFLTKEQITRISNWKSQQNPLKYIMTDNTEKSRCITARGAGEYHSGMVIYLYPNRKKIRTVSVLECERLQGLPDHYTDGCGVSRRERYRMLGNGFNIPTVAHCLSYMEI